MISQKDGTRCIFPLCRISTADARGELAVSSRQWEVGSWIELTWLNGMTRGGVMDQVYNQIIGHEGYQHKPIHT